MLNTLCILFNLFCLFNKSSHFYLFDHIKTKLLKISSDVYGIKNTLSIKIQKKLILEINKLERHLNKIKMIKKHRISDLNGVLDITKSLSIRSTTVAEGDVYICNIGE